MKRQTDTSRRASVWFVGLQKSELKMQRTFSESVISSICHSVRVNVDDGFHVQMTKQNS